MKTTTLFQDKTATRQATPVTINRLGSVEEELQDRIFRERDGERIFKFCRELSVVLIRGYQQCDGEIGELRANLRASLVKTLKCGEHQADCLIELALELVYVRLYGRYRRSNVDLSLLIATATGAVGDVSVN